MGLTPALKTNNNNNKKNWLFRRNLTPHWGCLNSSVRKTTVVMNKAMDKGVFYHFQDTF
jgi:hypothetical protein